MYDMCTVCPVLDPRLENQGQKSYFATYAIRQNNCWLTTDGGNRQFTQQQEQQQQVFQIFPCVP